MQVATKTTRNVWGHGREQNIQINSRSRLVYGHGNCFHTAADALAGRDWLGLRPTEERAVRLANQLFAVDGVMEVRVSQYEVVVKIAAGFTLDETEPRLIETFDLFIAAERDAAEDEGRRKEPR